MPRSFSVNRARPSTTAPGATVRAGEILEAACRVVARDGAHGLHMKAVAEEAGVSKALVHYYFATRQELLRRTFVHAEQHLDRIVDRRARGARRPAPSGSSGR